MGIHDRDYYRGDEGPGFSLGDGVTVTTKLVVINVAFYVADMLIGDNHWLMHQMSITPGTLTEPWNWWRFVSYAFAHSGDDTRHIIFNMLGLWFLGRDVELSMSSPWEYLRFYLGAAVFGALVWVARNRFHTPLGVHAEALGASGAVVAVVMLFVMMYPKRRILLMFVEVPAWVAGTIIIVMNVFGMHGDNVAYDIHLAGAGFAAAYHYFHWNFGRWLPHWSPPNYRRLKRFFRPQAQLKVHAPQEPEDDLELEADGILAKLHREGESSLTPRERRILEDYSRRVREKNGR